jgi:hypothetical protein
MRWPALASHLKLSAQPRLLTQPFVVSLSNHERLCLNKLGFTGHPSTSPERTENPYFNSILPPTLLAHPRPCSQ